MATHSRDRSRRFAAAALAALALAFASIAPAAGKARGLPPTIDLGIINIQQQNAVWCWAAVAQQIITKRRGQSPPQCALVAMANGNNPSYCCPDSGRCAVTGTLAQIQKLIANFGGRQSSIRQPSDPMSVYRMLRAGQPIILALNNAGQQSGHVVLLTGMSWVRTRHGAEPILHINDPYGTIPPRLHWRQLMHRWHAAIVVH